MKEKRQLDFQTSDTPPKSAFWFSTQFPPEDDARAPLKMMPEQSSNPSPQLKYVIILEVAVW